MKKNILIVDDEQDVLEVMTEIIHSLGFVPHCAKRADEAIAKFNSRKFDLVITDLIMPDMSGIELASSLSNRGKSIPIIITAGVDLRETGIDFSRFGIDDFVKKPFKIDEVETKIKTLLKLKSIQRSPAKKAKRLNSLTGRQ